MRARGPRLRLWRPIAVALAACALLIPALVPAGYMVSAGHGGATLTICTGHGALVIGGDRHAPAKGPVSQHDGGACVFAGHGVGAAPTAMAVAGAPGAFAHVVEPAALPVDLIPGRGLAAPPPPSQGPPTLST